MGVIDLSHFKQLNDQYGHSMGDSVLIAFPFLLQRFFRPVAGRLQERFGGEEFVVLLKNISSRKRRKPAFRNFYKKTLERNHSKFSISCSIGAAAPNQDGLPFTQVFLSADRALYTAKADGRNDACIRECTANCDDMPLMLIAEDLESPGQFCKTAWKIPSVFRKPLTDRRR